MKNTAGVAAPGELAAEEHSPDFLAKLRLPKIFGDLLKLIILASLHQRVEIDLVKADDTDHLTTLLHLASLFVDFLVNFGVVVLAAHGSVPFVGGLIPSREARFYVSLWRESIVCRASRQVDGSDSALYRYIALDCRRFLSCGC